jgi:fatty-acyl-CoA synthase
MMDFGERFEDVGFLKTAFCPSYGLAEAGLAVTMTPLGQHWRSMAFDPEEVRKGSVVSIKDRTRTVVSSGIPLDGYDVAIRGCDPVGVVQLRGPSVFDHYMGEPMGHDPNGWFSTNDLGLIDENHLYVVGRSDDVVVLAGRNIYVKDVEDETFTVRGVRWGRAAVFVVPGQGISVALEVDPTLGQDEMLRLLRDVRAAVVGRAGVSPDDVILLPRGHLPMTSSGKVRRTTLARLYQSGELEKITVG